MIWIMVRIYKEATQTPFEKINIVLIGDGIGTSMILAAHNAQMTWVSTYNTATIGILDDGFMVHDITLKNTAGTGVHQAMALLLDSDHPILYTIKLHNHQDTL